MEGRIEELHAKLVDLLHKQVDALELEIYVGLTDAERSEYQKRQESIRDLDVKISRSLDQHPSGLTRVALDGHTHRNSE